MKHLPNWNRIGMCFFDSALGRHKGYPYPHEISQLKELLSIRPNKPQHLMADYWYSLGDRHGFHKRQRLLLRAIALTYK